MTAQDTDRYQTAYLEHQARKKAILSGEAEMIEKNKSLTFKDLIENRQSQRIFNKKKITNKELNYIKKAIINTPSSCNRQGILIKIVREDKELLDEWLVGGKNWISKADIIILLLADMKCYKNPAEVSFMPYLDAGFIGMTVYYASEDIGLGCCFVNPHIREENQEKFKNKFGEKICGAIALGHYDKRNYKIKKTDKIFIK